MSEIQPHDVLAVAAHPDDVEMAMGGTVAALTAAGRRVMIVSLTRGELGTHGDAETRAREAADAAAILGCDFRLMDLPDGGVQDTLENRHLLASLVREFRPETVFAPYPHSRSGPLNGRSNVDHLAAGLLAREGAKLARFRKLMPERPTHDIRRLYYYMVPDDVRPSFIADVSAHAETLRRAIEAYASQMPIQRGRSGILEILMVQRQAMGLRIGCELGEPFVCEDALGGDAERLLEI